MFASRVPYMGILTIPFIITMTTGPADAITGYDCGSGIRNIATISAFVDPDYCDRELKVDDVETSVEIALLQVNEFEHVDIVQCKVEVVRNIYRCESQNNSVENVTERAAVKKSSHVGVYVEVDAISREDCLHAIRSGSLNLSGNQIVDLKQNVINERPITFAGSKTDNECDGANFSDAYGSWENVVVTGVAFITLSSQSAKVKTEDDIIYLPSGYQYNFSEGECVDVGRATFWDTTRRDNCSSNTYSLLYNGTATIYESKARPEYTFNVTDTSFSFTVIGTMTLCNATLLKTESSKLFLINTHDLRHLEESKIVKNTDNFDIFEYVSAKFVSVKKDVSSLEKSLHLDMMRLKCELEREILKNTLAIASTQPDVFALTYMNAPGYMAVVAGEAIHIVQCVPVEVKINHMDKCFHRLSVLRGDQSVFLMPRTHIITDSATEIVCHPALLDHYKLEGIWYKFTPIPVPAVPPMKLTPGSKVAWTNKDVAQLTAVGIYTQAELDSTRERIMLPLEEKGHGKTSLH